MADLLTEITDEELHERLASFGHPVTTKGRMTEAQRLIQKKKLNHLEAKERMDRDKADKQASKRANETVGSSFTLNKRAKAAGSRRRTVGVASSVVADEYEDAGVEFERDDPWTPVKSPLAHRDSTALNKNILDSSPLVIHLVDTFSGQAAAAVPVTLSVLHASKGWFQLAERQTNSEGGCPGLITKDLFQSGFYRIRFNTEEYYKRNSAKLHFPEVEIAIHVEEPGEKYTVSVLLMANGYTATVIKNT